jgi:6-phosphofructo-2-kinase/fructose-2,6-biphosphatase 2
MPIPNPPSPSSASGTLSRNLNLASSVLEKMQKVMDGSLSPGIPPARFGAGGPMSARPFSNFNCYSFPPALPLYRLKQFDESTASSRKGSQAPTPPLSVVGIGNKGQGLPFLSPRLSLWILIMSPQVAKPDYSEAKIVLATVIFISYLFSRR